MKKLLALLFCVIAIFSLTACSGMSISMDVYDEISEYVKGNADTLSTDKEIEFFNYTSTGISAGGVNYGYYYTLDDVVTVPDFYTGDDLSDGYQADGGTYFGKPNSGTDWCFVKKITDNWYYFELHW